MFRLLFPQLEIWLPNLRDKLRLSGKQRFMLLLLFFNALLLAILVLSVRNLEIVQRIAIVEVEITRVVERLQTVQSNQQRMVYITATPQQIAAATPTQTPTGTTAPGQPAQVTPAEQATATPAPAQTQTRPASPTATTRATPATTRTATRTTTPTVPATPTLTRVPTATTSPTATASRTATPSPTATTSPTVTPSPTPTLTPVPTATDTPAPTPVPGPTSTPAPVPSSIDLTASVSTVVADGTSSTVLTAMVRDQHGQPAPNGVLVVFTTDRGTFGGPASVSVPTVGGQAQAQLSSTTVGMATVIATCQGVVDSLNIWFVPGAPSSLVLNPSPASVPADGVSISTLQAHVTDAGGHPVADGTVVSFSTNLGTLSAPSAPTVGGMASVTLRSNAAGTAAVGATAGSALGSNTVSFTPTVLTPIPGSIAPATACNNAATAVTINGSNFSAGATARLGSFDLAAVWVSETALTGVVPRFIAAGTYDLVVTNPGGASGTLPGAYVATDCSSADTTLESGFLGTYGREFPAARDNGDNYQVQVIFVELAEGSGSFYIRIYDPECGGGLDRYIDSDTPFTYAVFGGSGTITHPDARSATPTTGVTSGTSLATATFTFDPMLDGQWYNMGPFDASQGEPVNGRRVFKLSVIAGPEPPFASGTLDTDLNLYNVAVSTSPSANTAPAGARLFAYSWTFMIPEAEWPSPPPIFAYVGGAVTSLQQNNLDYDNDTYGIGTAGLTITTPGRTIVGTDGDVSGSGVAQSSAYAVLPGETGATWTIECWSEPTGTPPVAIEDNLVTFWATDQGGVALPLFARPTTQQPPVP